MINTHKHTVYIASPIQTYHLPLYEHMQALIAALFPDSTLVFARGLYVSGRDWLEKWPMMRKQVDTLIFFCDLNGFIGRGVYVEVYDKLRENKPLFLITHEGTLYPFEQVELSEPNEFNWSCYASVAIKNEQET